MKMKHGTDDEFFTIGEKKKKKSRTLKKKECTEKHNRGGDLLTFIFSEKERFERAQRTESRKLNN